MADFFQDDVGYLYDDIVDGNLDEDQDFQQEDLKGATPFLYPQAGLRHGNVQASSPPSAFQARVSHINKLVRRTAAHNPIRCGNFQAYNYVSHVTRTSAQTHIAQNAPLTQLFAGTMLNDPKNNTRFVNARTNSELGELSHVRLQRLVTSAPAAIAAEYRLEVVIKIHMDDLEPRMRSGQ